MSLPASPRPRPAASARLRPGRLGLEQGGGLLGGALGGLGRLLGGALGLGDQLAALGQELGLVGRAGDQRGDVDRDLRMEVDLDLVRAQRLDRLVELDLAALDLDAAAVAASAMSREVTEP
jgi:hypothetical protein